MSIEKTNNLETPEQRTEALKNRVLSKVKNLEGADKTFKALDLALSLHTEQRPRPDGPYVDHILRGVDRLLDLGITDPDILIASLFHDSVEDQAQKLADKISTAQELNIREKALEFLREKYGEKVADIINSVTNPEELDNLETEEANREYVSHIQHAIENQNVFYVKLSDFMDNGLKFMDISDIRRKNKLAKKYLPLFQIFINRIGRDDISLPQERKDEIISELSKAESFAVEAVSQN